LIIGVIVTASGFTHDLIGDYIGPIEYKGYLVFDYPEGENPIINIVFTIDSTLANNLIIVDVPSAWSHIYGGGILTLSGGSVGPGGTVRVTVSLNKYFEDGEYPVSSVGTTTAGEESYATGPLLVGKLYLLKLIDMASAIRFPLTAVMVGLIFLDYFYSRRKHAVRTIAITDDSTDSAPGIEQDDEGFAPGNEQEDEGHLTPEDQDDSTE
jgi:hypothetical protein